MGIYHLVYITNQRLWIQFVALRTWERLYEFPQLVD